MATKRKQLKFEAVRQENHQWTVKTQLRKNGAWHTVAETFCINGVMDAEETANFIAEKLNEREELSRKAKDHVFDSNNGCCKLCGALAEDELMAPTKCRPPFENDSLLNCFGR